MRAHASASSAYVRACDTVVESKAGTTMATAQAGASRTYIVGAAVGGRESAADGSAVAQIGVQSCTGAS